MGKYSAGLEQALKNRQKAVEDAVVAFVEANKEKLPFEFVEIKSDGDIKAYEIAKELDTDPDFEVKDVPGDQRAPGYISAKFVKKIYSQSDL